MKYLLFLVFLVTIPFVFALPVNQSINFLVKLQNDNGTAISNVVDQACIGSLYFHGNSSLVIRDQPLLNTSNFHSFLFTPDALGLWTVSVECTFNNDTVFYHQDIVIDTPPQPTPSGGAPIVLNNEIKPDADSFTVNLQENSSLNFSIHYSVGSVASTANQEYFRVYSNDVLLKEGILSLKSQGVYAFDYDFRDWTLGNYRIELFFDGKSDFVDLHIISQPSFLNFLTSDFILPSGEMDKPKTILWSIILILFIGLLVFIILRSRRKASTKPKRAQTL